MTFFTSISCGTALGAVAMEDIEVKYDAKEQKSYYYNRRTSKAGWSIEDVKGAQAAEAPPPPPGGGGGAADHSHIEERHDTERRRSYFYNKQTGKSGWSKEEVPPAPQLLFSDTCTHVLRDEPELTCLTPTRAGWASRGRSRGRPSPGKRVSRPPGGTGMSPPAARSRAPPPPPPSAHTHNLTTHLEDVSLSARPSALPPLTGSVTVCRLSRRLPLQPDRAAIMGAVNQHHVHAPPAPAGGAGAGGGGAHIEERHDAARGRSYFYNTTTGKSGWSRWQTLALHCCVCDTLTGWPAGAGRRSTTAAPMPRQRRMHRPHRLLPAAAGGRTQTSPP
jgi:hypothetical protein